MESHLLLIVGTIMPHFMNDRFRKVSGMVYSRAEGNDDAHEHDVNRLATAEGALCFLDETTLLANAISCAKDGGGRSYTLALADGSCECPANQREACKHVLAAGRKAPLTLECLHRAAGVLAEKVSSCE